MSSLQADHNSNSVQAQQLSQGRIYGIPVTVTEINPEADGVISIVMSAEDGGELPEWEPGAHIDIVIDDQLELVRQYSLCGDPSDCFTYKVGVLKEPAGRGGSEALHNKLQVGDRLTIKGPRNNFPLVEADHYLMIAGGIGVTPILSMIRELEKAGKSWHLLYGGRSRVSMAFIDELAGYAEKVTVAPEDETGLLDIAGFIGEPRANVAVYVCGPEPLICAVEDACQQWPEGALNLERFKPKALPDSEAEDRPFEVVLQQSGVTIEVGKDESIADAVEKAGFYIPRSCDEGTCGTCLTRVVEGTPEHRDSFLRGKMREGNQYIMVCCSRSKTPKLVLDA
jgi:ferredoxin-NADP reductase